MRVFVQTTSVSASWTQPTGTCSRGDQYAAFWVGLDGYSSSSVEQTGSEVDCVGRTAECYAWYEMYPNPSVNYSNTVRPGDHFNASVTYTGGNSFSPPGRSHPSAAGPALARRHSVRLRGTVVGNRYHGSP